MQEPGPVRGGKTRPLQIARVFGTAGTHLVDCGGITQWLGGGLVSDSA